MKKHNRLAWRRLCFLPCYAAVKYEKKQCAALYSVVAAATEYYNDSEDYNPCAVIVEDVAEAVVVHKVLQDVSCGAFICRTILSYAGRLFFANLFLNLFFAFGEIEDNL